MYEPRYAAKKRRRLQYCRLYLLPAMLLTVGMLAACVHSLAEQPADNTIATLTEPPTESEAPKDIMPPELAGVRDLTVYAGDEIAWLDGITAADDRDPAPGITVDSSAVDGNTPGTYEIIYTAADAAGNSSRAAAMVTVLEKGEGFVDIQTIYTAADERLAALLWEGATVEEQVRTIYNWARSALSYGGHSDRSDWRQTAYTMLTQYRGDCFGYFAVTKLLLERLGIPNIDVQKVRNSEKDSDHFWSLVSVDGGVYYYHFDATPRYGSGDDFCLVTDAFLDAYSENHRNSHNRDQSLYPATPEEAL